MRGRRAEPREKGSLETRRSAGAGSARAPDGAAAETLRRELQGVFGLNLYEARVLLALLQLGSANSAEIARLAQLPRTNTYPVMESLQRRGLVDRLPGDGVIGWTTPGSEAVLDRLDAAVEDAREREAKEYRARAEALRTTLFDILPRIPAAALSEVQVIRGSARVKRLYEQMLSRAEMELQMFTRPPYAAPAGYVNPAVTAMLSRGIGARVVYETGLDQQPEFAAYHEAGVVARVADNVPLKLVIVDRRLALVGMPDLIEPTGYPTSLYVEHPAFGELLSLGFESVWAQARPYRPPAASRSSPDLDDTSAEVTSAPTRRNVARPRSGGSTAADGVGAPSSRPRRRRRGDAA